MGRRFTAAELHAAKLLAVALSAKGKTQAEIVKLTGLSRPTVADAIRRKYAALAPARRGRKRGTGRHLSPERELRVRHALRDREPRDFGIAAKKWTAAAVKALINKWFPRSQIGKQPEMSMRTVRRNLARWTQTKPSSTAAIAKVTSGDILVTEREAEAMALWELLGWYPGPTGKLASSRASGSPGTFGEAVYRYRASIWTTE